MILTAEAVPETNPPRPRPHCNFGNLFSKFHIFVFGQQAEEQAEEQAEGIYIYIMSGITDTQRWLNDGIHKTNM